MDSETDNVTGLHLVHCTFGQALVIPLEMEQIFIGRLSMYNGVIVVAPPVVTRAYQELSRGIVNLQNASALAQIQTRGGRSQKHSMLKYKYIDHIICYGMPRSLEHCLHDC